MQVNLETPRPALFGRPIGRLLPALVCAGLALSPRIASAQQSDGVTALEPLTVTAARVPQEVADTLPSSSVITRADIENSQATDVLSLLVREAGLEVAQTGGLGGQASVFMRGFNSNQTLVLVDGIPINAVESGGASLQHIMLDQVERIEIVRGNVSALYGSQAVGGVIQIFTRAGAASDGALVTAQAGGERTRNLGASFASTLGEPGSRTHLGLSVSTNGVDGFSAINAGIAPAANPNDNPYQSTSLAAQVSQQVGESEFGVRLYGTHGRLSYDDPTDYSFLAPGYNGRIQTNEEHSDLATSALYGRIHASDFWTASVQVGTSLDRSANTSSFPESFVIGTTQSRTDELSWNNVFALGPLGKVTAGLEHLEVTGTSSAYSQEFTRHVDSLLLGYLADLGPNQVQANVRADHYSDFGEATSGLVGYGYRLTDSLKAIVELSTAFDAPTFDDLYYPGLSNPKLQPEKSRSVEWGLAYQGAATTLRATAFRSDVHDLIEFDSVTGIPSNIDAARLTGVELSGRTRWQGFELYGNLTLQRPIDVATDQVLLRRATHNVNLGLARSDGPWRWSIDVRGAGARFDSDINTFSRIQLGGYSVTDLVARYEVNPQATVSASLLNAFDRGYELEDGYNTPGRVLLLALALRF